MSKYKVTANLDDGMDYFWHEEREFNDYEEAYKFWDEWYPDDDDMYRTIVEYHEAATWDQDPNDYMLQIALWDEDGNELEFWNRGYSYEECKSRL